MRKTKRRSQTSNTITRNPLRLGKEVIRSLTSQELQLAHAAVCDTVTVKSKEYDPGCGG